MISLVVATRNAHKVGEIQAILGPGFSCVPLTAFPGAPELREDGDTFAANAAQKAGQLADWIVQSASASSGLPGLVLADDSGLEVDALDGAPGVLSARFAAADAGSSGNAPDAANNAKLLRLLQNVPCESRTARFRCVLALVAVGESPEYLVPRLFEGSCEGRIAREPSGRGGFGYDPLFIPDGMDQSFAELGEETKNRLSHRSKALAGLREWLADLKPGT